MCAAPPPCSSNSGGRSRNPTARSANSASTATVSPRKGTPRTWSAMPTTGARARREWPTSRGGRPI
ncbi:hypothetical protein I548_0560 [Mycobacterium intracellulare]|nr:hypothetical protein I548_0560 [Mycobacterium intracellulare]